VLAAPPGAFDDPSLQQVRVPRDEVKHAAVALSSDTASVRIRRRSASGGTLPSGAAITSIIAAIRARERSINSTP
jgi:hypothetical protein